MTKKILRKILTTSLVISALTFTIEIYFSPIASVVHAEIKEYVGVGESIVSDRETIEIGKQGARLQALRNAQKQAGVFISSHSVTRNYELESDEIVAFTADVVKINDNIKYEPVQVEQWIKYRATVTVTIDTDNLTAKINQWLGKTSQDRTMLTERSRDLNNTLERIQTRTAEIETVIAGATTEIEQVKAEIQELDKDILYAQKIWEGNEALRTGRRDKAQRLYNEAIAIYPKDATIAYEKLGDSYLEAKDYSRAIDAYSKVIQMDPNYVTPYHKRGDSYLKLKDYRKAFADFVKVIEIEPKSSLMYHCCCDVMYASIRGGDYDLAIEIYRKTPWLNEYTKPEKIYVIIINVTEKIKSGSAGEDDYLARGEAFFKLEEYKKALDDFTKSIELADDVDFFNYYWCAATYLKIGEYKNAINDYNKVLRLVLNHKLLLGKKFPAFSSWNGVCYHGLGKCYDALGDKAKAIENYKKALKEELSSKSEQEIKERLSQLKKSK